ncbi:hypothetical protein Pmar_PMAR019185 [Perkinsus marinus ATCC 50983]|uniref:Uncharacterized protein n=1 Tax=Perkinsus marinus (strain ATCC 50983 / TXsc) TaxID=423536 RepID=C5KU38_PERM5|nr:hypothetical protein Pmar_PMAR019185 [Perkinsus marinus ATCC 50983]EER12080.1 hypothetical protein Pmar_PMAR019185 [Perkinsus marinus ATCC 50983]|eukprot:XP_002780285.1 hypothetical protein Pmar_PMAR019185 [Perkinsus marinus ATCC 50983]
MSAEDAGDNAWYCCICEEWQKDRSNKPQHLGAERHRLHSSYKSIISQQKTLIKVLLTCGPLIFEYVGKDAGTDAGNDAANDAVNDAANDAANDGGDDGDAGKKSCTEA